MGKQESLSDYYEMAKYEAKAERELKVEHWFHVTIQYHDDNGNYVILYTYDLPREMYFKYDWVIRWRTAKLQCKYPKQIVSTSLYFYDKCSGESMEVNGCLSKLISAKAQITKAERRMNEYIEYNRQNNLFFDEESDEELVKFREKLERKKLECAECEKRLELLVERRRSNQ